MTTERARSPWQGRVGLAAMVVIAVAWGLHAVSVAGSFFNQDDYVAMAWVREYGFSWDYLTIEFAGHVGPGQRLLYYAIVHLSPMSWLPPAAVIDLLMLCGLLVMWCLLVRLVGPTRHALFGLVMFAVAPMVLMVSLWFGAAIAWWPPVLAGLSGSLLFLRGHQGARGGAWNLALVPVVMVLGLTFQERSLMVAPLVFGVAMLAGGPAGAPQGPIKALLAFWRLWLGLAVVAVAYLAFYLSQVDMGGGLNPDPLKSVQLVAWLLGRAVAPGVMGGPWQAARDGGAIVPALWVAILCSVAVVVILVLGVWRGGRVGRLAVLAFLAYTVIDTAILLVSRGGFGPVIALDPRYSADMIVPATICLVAALGGRDRPWFVVRRPTAQKAARYGLPAAALALVVGAAGTVISLAPGGQNREDRTFITNIRSALRSDQRTVLIDRQVPADILIGVFGPYTALSRLLELLPEEPLFNVPSEHLKVVADDGRVLDPEILLPAVMRGRTGQACRQAVGARRTRSTLSNEVRGNVLVRVDYFTNTTGTLSLGLGRRTVQLPVREGANRVQAMVDAGTTNTSAVTLQAKQFGATVVCVTQITAGEPHVP